MSVLTAPQIIDTQLCSAFKVENKGRKKNGFSLHFRSRSGLGDTTEVITDNPRLDLPYPLIDQILRQPLAARDAESHYFESGDSSQAHSQREELLRQCRMVLAVSAATVSLFWDPDAARLVLETLLEKNQWQLRDCKYISVPADIPYAVSWVSRYRQVDPWRVAVLAKLWDIEA